MRMSGKNEYSLYFHIPFCSRKCDYCHFFVLPDREQDKDLLMRGFEQEWQRWLPEIRGKDLVSIYFGGGTPSLLGPERISKILGWVGTAPEITLEANPESISLINDYRSAGINRVSIGLQTLDNRLLTQLGRTHTAEQAIEAVEATAKSGISNISVDLMYEIPFQDMASWEKTLQQLRQLPITHLSLYNLTFEPETVFFKKRAQLQPAVADTETRLQMYLRAVESLEEMGLKQYEISAFAKPGCHSRHNVGYWTARPFLGFGPSAFSYWEGRRFRNVAHLKRYSEALESGHSPVDFSEELEPAARQRELLAVQLRLVEGVDLGRFGPLDKELVQVVEQLEGQKLLIIEGNSLRLTPRGRLLYDTVATEII